MQSSILSHREFVIGLCVVCIACLCNRCTEVGLIYWVWIKLCLEAECIAVIVFDSTLAFLSHDKVGSIKLDSDTVGVYLHLYATLSALTKCSVFKIEFRYFFSRSLLTWFFGKEYTVLCVLVSWLKIWFLCFHTCFCFMCYDRFKWKNPAGFSRVE